MAEFYSNVSLMSAMIVKVLLVTGIGPGILVFLVWRKLHEKRTIRSKARVIEFPSWGRVRRDRKMGTRRVYPG